MSRGLLLNGILCGIIVLGILVILGGAKETFISRGAYPKSLDKRILSDTYPMKTPGGLSNWNYSNQWELYPTWAVGSYAQKTNNIKNWSQPCNGTAAPADVCGGLYNPIKVKDPCIHGPPVRNCLRVNYYCYQ